MAEIKQVMVPRWAAAALERVVFEGWALVESVPVGARRQLLVYEAEVGAPAPMTSPRAAAREIRPSKRAGLDKVQRAALKVAVQQRAEPQVGDEYILTGRIPYRATMGGATYLLPSQVLKAGDRVVVRQKLPTGVWRFDILHSLARHRGDSFTVSRKEWEEIKPKLRMAGDGDEGGAKIDDDPLADLPGFKKMNRGKGGDKGKDGDQSPLSTAGSYLRVTKELPDLPIPKKFEAFFAAPLPKRPPPPPEGEDGEGGGGGNPFGRFGRR